MKAFKEYLRENTPIQKAEQALLAGDYESAKKHLTNHVPGKSRRNDAYVAKLMLALKQKGSKEK